MEINDSPEGSGFWKPKTRKVLCMTESVFGGYQKGRQRKHRSVCTCDGRVFNVYTGQECLQLQQQGLQPLHWTGVSTPVTAGSSTSTLDSLYSVGDTLLEVVRTARLVTEHGKLAMILPVPQQDLRTVTKALSCGICKEWPPREHYLSPRLRPLLCIGRDPGIRRSKVDRHRIVEANAGHRHRVAGIGPVVIRHRHLVAECTYHAIDRSKRHGKQLKLLNPKFHK